MDDHLSFTANEDGEFWKKPTQSEGVQFADVSVDTETGIVRVNKVVALQNVGLPVNRNTIENQLTGAVIQGLSFCLFEDRILNRQTGAMVNPNMDMYKIAGPMDVPEIVPVIWREDRDVGVNSLGEPPVVPTPGAIATAVANAIGAQVRSMPITPDKVLAAVQAASRNCTASECRAVVRNSLRFGGPAGRKGACKLNHSITWWPSIGSASPSTARGRWRSRRAASTCSTS